MLTGSSRFAYICAISALLLRKSRPLGVRTSLQCILDLFSRKILAYKVSVNIDTKLVLYTFRLAYTRREYPKGVIFHSDQGAQYTAKEFRKVLDEADFVQSFLAKGHSFDNAVVESFFKYLKHEELNRRTFNTVHELNLSLFEYDFIC